jgi:simple sugar transport system permease protein
MVPVDAVSDFIINWIANIPQLAAPYALAALGLIVSERAGVLTITAEGLMLVGALAGIIASTVLGGQPFAALAFAMLAASLVSGLFGALVVAFRVNQVIAGLATVFFCQGLTNLIGARGDFTNHAVAGLGKLAIGPLSQIPVVGHILFSQDAIVYAIVPIFFLVDRLLFRSTLGLRLRAVGENPDAANAAGISVSRYRFAAVLAGAALIGLAGGYLSVVHTKIWIQDMTNGRGWIAVALVIFSRWRPWRALGGALLFGGIEALIPRLAAAGVALPQYFMLMTPYLATLAVMVWSSRANKGRADGPASLGQPHVREERR